MKKIADFTTEELLRISCFEKVKKESRWAMVLEIAKRYYASRDFNFYEEAVKRYFKSDYHLGRTKLFTKSGYAWREDSEFLKKRVERGMKFADLFLSNEKEEKEPIPVEHAKYFFAFIKELVQHLAATAVKKEDEGLLKALAGQFEAVRKILQKEKNNEDILTVLEGIIADLKRRGVLALEPVKEQESSKASSGTEIAVAGKRKLDIALSKLSKAAALALLAEINSYEDESYFKLTHHVFSKYGRSEFRPMFPVLATAMLRPDKRMSNFETSYKDQEWRYAFRFDLHDYLHGLFEKGEEPAREDFGPVPAESFGGFLEFVKRWFEEKVREGVLSEEDARLIFAAQLLELRGRGSYSESAKKEIDKWCFDISLPLYEKEMRALMDGFGTWEELLNKRMPVSQHFDALQAQGYGKINAASIVFYIGKEGKWKKNFQIRRKDVSRYRFTSEYEDIAAIEETGAFVLSALLNLLQPQWKRIAELKKGKWEVSKDVPQTAGEFVLWCEQTLPSFSLAAIPTSTLESLGTPRFNAGYSSESPLSFALARRVEKSIIEPKEITTLMKEKGLQKIAGFGKTDPAKYAQTVIGFIDKGELPLENAEQFLAYVNMAPSTLAPGMQLQYDLARRFDEELVAFLEEHVALSEDAEERYTKEQQIGQYAAAHYRSGHAEANTDYQF